MNEPKSDPPAASPTEKQEHAHSPPQPNHPAPPAPEDSEMGGEAACQLHRWWDGNEDAD